MAEPAKADDAYLAIEWSCHGENGIGGEPVLDPLVVYVTPYEVMQGEDDASTRVQFHLAEVIDELIESNIPLGECQVRVLRQIAFAFRGLAKKIEDAVLELLTVEEEKP